MLTECWLLFIGKLNVGVISKYEIENKKKIKPKQTINNNNKNPQKHELLGTKNSLFMV